MPQKKGNVVFRRVRGRIVPIRAQKRPYGDVSKITAATAGGTALAFGAGRIAPLTRLEVKTPFSAFLKHGKSRAVASAFALTGAVGLVGYAAGKVARGSKNQTTQGRIKDVGFGVLGSTAVAAPFLIGRRFRISKFLTKFPSQRDNLQRIMGHEATRGIAPFQNFLKRILRKK